MSQDVLDQPREQPTVQCVNCGAVFKPAEGEWFEDDTTNYIHDEFCPACGAPYEIVQEGPDDY